MVGVSVMSLSQFFTRWVTYSTASRRMRFSLRRSSIRRLRTCPSCLGRSKSVSSSGMVVGKERNKMVRRISRNFQVFVSRSVSRAQSR